MEYEVLLGGSDEPWEFVGVSCNDLPSTSEDVGFREHEKIDDDKARVDIATTEASPSASASHCNDRSSEMVITEEKDQINRDENRTSEVEAGDDNIDSDEDPNFYGPEDIERLTCEIGSMRDNLRHMPDFQRRDMAAKLAVKMASMFGYNSVEDVN